MYGRKIYADHNLIINQQVLYGVTNFTSNFEVPYEYVDVLGKTLVTEVQTNTEKNISFNRFLINSDRLKYLTGEFSCNGNLNYKDKSYGFENAYLTNYNVSCGIGDLVDIETSFVVYGNIGGGIKQTPIDSPVNQIYVPNFGTIDLNANEGRTNRITSFNYAVTCERVPLFKLGSIYPSEVILKKPITIDLSINIDIDDYESTTIQDLICSSGTQNLIIDLKNCNKTQIIESYSIPNARLISNSYELSIENAANVELVFRGFLM
jgi:hypothetical protein